MYIRKYRIWQGHGRYSEYCSICDTGIVKTLGVPSDAKCRCVRSQDELHDELFAEKVAADLCALSRSMLRDSRSKSTRLIVEGMIQRYARRFGFFNSNVKDIFRWLKETKEEQCPV